MAKNKETTKQWNDLKAKYPDAVFLFRCGDFYEAYHDDARACAKILGITLTFHGEDKMPMAGFPHHALDKYLPMLVRKGKRVAICDQLEDPRQVKNNNNQKTSTTMKETFKAADLIGKTIVVGDNQATIVIKSVDGDKLSGEFTKDGKTTPMSFPISQLHGMTEKGLWKLTDSTEATDVTTEADVQEVQDIVPVVTPRKPESKAEEPKEDKPTAKVEPIKATVKPEPKPKAKDVKPETKGGKYAYATYQTKKGKTGAKITGFASEDDVFYAMAADIHASGSYERDKQGNKHYYLCFGPRYAEAAKSICKVLNSDKTVNQKAEECKLIVSQATEELATKREEWKQKREERKAQAENKPKAEKPAKGEKTYTQTELAEWLSKLNAGDPKAAKFFNDLAKAA